MRWRRSNIQYHELFSKSPYLAVDFFGLGVDGGDWPGWGACVVGFGDEGFWSVSAGFSVGVV